MIRILIVEDEKPTAASEEQSKAAIIKTS